MKLNSFVIAVALLSAAAVQAQTPPAPTPEQKAAREAVRQACATDMQSLCSGKEGHEAMMCLRSNSDKVSSGCKDAMSKLHRPGGGGTPPAQ
jgi:hypothetical protein